MRSSRGRCRRPGAREGQTSARSGAGRRWQDRQEAGLRVAREEGVSSLPSRTTSSRAQRGSCARRGRRAASKPRANAVNSTRDGPHATSSSSASRCTTATATRASSARSSRTCSPRCCSAASLVTMDEIARCASSSSTWGGTRRRLRHLRRRPLRRLEFDEVMQAPQKRPEIDLGRLSHADQTSSEKSTKSRRGRRRQRAHARALTWCRCRRSAADIVARLLVVLDVGRRTAATCRWRRAAAHDGEACRRPRP